MAAARAARLRIAREALDEKHPIWDQFVHAFARLVQTFVLACAPDRSDPGGSGAVWPLTIVILLLSDSANQVEALALALVEREVVAA